MPRIGTAAKTKRDRDILAGLPALMGNHTHLDLPIGRKSLAELRAMFEEHLRAMPRVWELTIARRVAIQAERALEARLRPVVASLKDVARSRAGKHDARNRDYGFEPDRKPVMSATTKLLANVKRQATRKERGIVGKKRRRRKGT